MYHRHRHNVAVCGLCKRLMESLLQIVGVTIKQLIDVTDSIGLYLATTLM